uniref:Uncharacterized protein n=1 Tax=Anguilla anguilla TaxID=7936 RepID=A0A0E9QT03_ANGAN
MAPIKQNNYYTSLLFSPMKKTWPGRTGEG